MRIADTRKEKGVCNEHETILEIRTVRHRRGRTDAIVNGTNHATADCNH